MAKIKTQAKKSGIEETKHLLTDADSSTDAKGGWTQNSPKPNFFLKTEKIIQNAKTQKTSRNRPKLAIRPSTRGLLSMGKRGFHHVLLDPLSSKVCKTSFIQNPSRAPPPSSKVCKTSFAPFPLKCAKFPVRKPLG